MAVSGSSFVGNHVEYFVGAIYALDTTSVEIANCSFVENRGTYFAGALYAQHGVVSITDSDFLGNSAKEFSGALYVQVRQKAAIEIVSRLS